jgi:hypothetical protein
VTPPLWMNSEEEQAARAELEQFARTSVQAPVSIAGWVTAANLAYPMGLAPVPEDEIRNRARYMSSGVDLDEAGRRSQSKTLTRDIGETVLSPSQKTTSGAHAQVNKAISIAEYGAGRAEHYDRIRRDLSGMSQDREVLEDYLKTMGFWDEAFAGTSADVNAIIATLYLLKRKNSNQPPDPNSTAYLWQSHMQCVARIFRELIVAVPHEMDNPFGVQPPDNTGPVCTLLGEKAVTGTLGTIGENLELKLQEQAWQQRDSSLFKVKDTDSLDARKDKGLARWHTSVKDILGTWFKGDLRQVLLNEKVGFRDAEQPGTLEHKSTDRFETIAITRP